MMMTIAPRFIPTLGEEAEKIGAQAARGADFSEGDRFAGPAPRARARPADRRGFPPRRRVGRGDGERGYKGRRGRTRFRELRFRVRDALALGITVLVLLIGVLFEVRRARRVRRRRICRMGRATRRPKPRASSPKLSPRFYASPSR